MIGIYKITNILDDKVYIGESMDIDRRWEEHITQLNNNSHYNKKLQNDWNLHGEIYFSFEILEELEKQKNPYVTNMVLIYNESKYIEKYNSIKLGYNLENTMKRILIGEKIIMDKKLDIKYMKYLIEHNGIPSGKQSFAKKKPSNQKPKTSKPSNPNNHEGINCIKLLKTLIEDNYNISFTPSIYKQLEDINILYRENNSFYIKQQYIDEGYFINGKEQKNDFGFIFYQILVTEAGKQFIIEQLSLTK